jgi:hypothetical protein
MIASKYIIKINQWRTDWDILPNWLRIIAVMRLTTQKVPPTVVTNLLSQVKILSWKIVNPTAPRWNNSASSKRYPMMFLVSGPPWTTRHLTASKQVLTESNHKILINWTTFWGRPWTPKPLAPMLTEIYMIRLVRKPQFIKNRTSFRIIKLHATTISITFLRINHPLIWWIILLVFESMKNSTKR